MTFMATEIAETPEIVARLLSRERPAIRDLAKRLAASDPAVIVTGARGSSDHAVAHFKYLVEILLGIPVASVGPSVASIYRSPLRLQRAVLVSVSQSGQSPDIIALQDLARAAGAPAVAVVNDTGSRLAAGAGTVLDIGAGEEKSVAATKTCIASAVALAALVAAWRQDEALEAALDRLPETLARAAMLSWDVAEDAFVGAQSAYVLGRGPGLPVAAEAALKCKETAAIHAEAFSGAEVLHGPLQLLQADLPVLAFRSEDPAASAMDETIARVVRAGSRVFVTSPAESGPSTLPVAPAGHWALDPLSILLTFYRFVESVSRARGYDPDRPAQLSKVTRTV